MPPTTTSPRPENADADSQPKSFRTPDSAFRISVIVGFEEDLAGARNSTALGSATHIYLHYT
jgi:hypothetical protein